jgi:hypothetical protein
MNVGNVVQNNNTHQVTVLVSTQATVRKIPLKLLARLKLLAKLFVLKIL